MSEASAEKVCRLPREQRYEIYRLLSHGGDPMVRRVVSDEAVSKAVSVVTEQKSQV